MEWILLQLVFVLVSGFAFFRAWTKWDDEDFGWGDFILLMILLGIFSANAWHAGKLIDNYNKSQKQMQQPAQSEIVK